MCESSVWVRYGDGRSEKVAEDILIARQEGDWVVLRGLMKEPQCIRAMIHEADSLKHTITLVSPDSSADSPAAHWEGGKRRRPHGRKTGENRLP